MVIPPTTIPVTSFFVSILTLLRAVKRSGPVYLL